MLENTTVTLPLSDFDTLRDGEREYKNLASALAACFDYTCKKNPEPKECRPCSDAESENDCLKCKFYTPDYDEKLTVDVERLIGVAKEYALYNKDIETDLDAIAVERKAERVDA